MRIQEFLDEIRKKDVVLPEFQREYVWSREQAKQLVVSLYKRYPVGSLLLWKTDSPPELKNLNATPDKLGTVRVLLDGQQRMTTLHMLLYGDIPIFYSEADIENDPRDLFFHLESGDFQYFQQSRMAGDPMWRRVVDCFCDKSLSVIAIANESADNPTEKLDLSKRLNDNLNQLRSILDMELPEQIVPHHASLDDAIDIFDRVNSQGTKLTEADLALTPVTGKWPQARRVMKKKIDECGYRHFAFGLTFMTRALTAVATGRALFETIHGRNKQDLEEGWQKLSVILDYLMSLLPSHASIHLHFRLKHDKCTSSGHCVPVTPRRYVSRAEIDSSCRELALLRFALGSLYGSDRSEARSGSVDCCQGSGALESHARSDY